jgi:MtN3 and saliva related transmembrane protein
MTTVAFFQQILHSWRTRDLAGISLSVYALFTIGVALWLGYGLPIDSLPIVAANGITLALTSVVLWLKIRPTRN